MTDAPRVAALILAAGGSSRMGRSKQALPWRGVPLARRLAIEAIASSLSNVYAVVGCDAAATRLLFEGLDLEIVENPRWEEGLGSSLAAGARHLAALPDPPDAAVILLADQALVTSTSIDALIDAHCATGLPLVACRHGEELGAPALFASSFFARLEALRGDEGARTLLRENADRVTAVDLPEALFDVDTPADFERLP
ncbi:MAG: nucleotidyltransferase family protein [Acidobacteriota bacterium]